MDWMDKMLGIRNVDRLPDLPIKIFVMGTGDGSKGSDGRLQHGGYWKEVNSWPLEDAQSVTYYFNGEGGLDAELNTTAYESTTFTYDPMNPVPTIGGNVSARVKDGAFHQRERPDFHGSQPPFLPLKSRDDILVFQSEPLDQEVTIAGPIEVILHCSSTAVDTDFTVKLLDIYPPSSDFPEGYDLNLTDGIVRMSYRNARKTRELIQPNQVYEVKLNLFPTANLFKKGHRIRVDISSSNFPRWDLNPNSGEPLGESRRKIEADNTIYHSQAFPSRIVLPIITRSED
jgi:hypothetical protein